MPAVSYVPDQPAARVHTSLRRSLKAMENAQQCSVLWFAEVMRRHIYREFGCASINQYALTKLGFFESFLCMASYAKARLFPVKDPQTFEEWVTNEFGHRLFTIFFETYTEKVWGMKCREISADWAAQRIKGLSLGGAIRSAMAPRPSFS